MFRILYALALVSGLAQAQVTTAFSYQGELEQAGNPASGAFDFEFLLFDTASGGTAIVGPVNVEDVLVSGGLFTIEIDFGMNVFGVMDLWLEIRVREGDSTGGFTILAPRQKITPAPLAHHALNVEPGAVDMAQLAPGAVASAQIADGSIQAIDVNSAQVQLRIGAACSPGSAISTINADGTVACEIAGGDITSVIAGSGLTGGAVSGDATLAVDTSTIQSRVTGTCGPAVAVTGINADGSLNCRELPIGVALTVDDAGDVGRGSSLVVRTNDHPIISYYDLTNGDLRLFDCADPACSSGTVRTLDSAGDVGRWTSIAIRLSGVPIISYYDSTNEDLKVFDCVDTACSSGTARTLDSTGDVGIDARIAIRASGNPIISYFDRTNGDLKVFDCADAACSSGTARTVDSLDVVGNHGDIAIRGNGNPIISYNDFTNRELKVFDCADSGCASGTARSLDSTGDVGFLTTSVAVRATGNPIISYYDFTNDHLKVFDCADTGCSSGTARILESGAATNTSITIRSGGNPIISYSSGVLRVFDCDDAGCESGVRRTLDQNGGSDSTSIGLRATGNPIISYYDQTNGRLKVFSCGDSDCEY